MPPSLVAPADAALMPPRWRWARNLLRLLAAVVVAGWSLLLIAWLTLYWGILPHVDEWRGQIETRASRALGVPVKIGAIRVESRGWVPSLELSDVVLHDAQQREALRLPRVAAAVSARSLLALRLRFEQLLIEAPALDVRRDRQGRLFVAGIEVPRSQGSGDNPAADWLFEQHELAIRHGALRWTDELRNVPTLALSDVDLVIRNGLHRHGLRLDATPPAGWGERFSLRGQFSRRLLSRPGDWRQWTGNAFAELPRTDVSQLRRYVDLPFELDQGDGALRLWAEVAGGEVRGATLDLALQEVALRLAPEVQPLALQQVQGRLQGQRDARGWRLAGQQIGFTTADGLQWPQGNFTLVLRDGGPAQPNAPQGGELSADRLDLALLTRIGEAVPMAEDLRQALAQAAPEGRVENLAARWEGPWQDPQRYNLKARLAGVSVAAAPAPKVDEPGRPGLRQAQVDLEATERGGKARLRLDGGALELPGVFEQPLVPFDRFQAQVDWRIEPARTAGAPPALSVKVSDLQFSNADATAELSATWRTGPGEGHGAGRRFPGVLDMSGKLQQGRAAAVARYLPLVLPEDTRRYVADAVQAGEIPQASFRVRGDLWQFPYSDPRQGEFRIAGKVAGVTLAYVPARLMASPADARQPAWPPFENVAGELVFERSSMAIRQASGRVFGATLNRINGGIADLDKAVLRIDGQVRGPGNELLQYVRRSPVDGWTGRTFATSTITGPADLRLALDIPLDDTDRSTVKGSVTLAGNDVRLRPDVPLLANARGRVDFTETSVKLVGTRASALGGELVFDGGTQSDGSLRFNGQGTATADGLRRATELGGLARLAQALNGQLPYRLSLGFIGEQTEVTLTSPLTGLAIDLPAPLRKTAEVAMPLRVEVRPLPGQAPRDQLRLDLGGVVQAQYLRDLSTPQPRVLSGGIGVRVPAPVPASGVQAQVQLASLDVDEWEKAVERLAAVPATPPTAASAPAPASASADEGYLPRSVALQVQQLAASGRRLDRVVAGASEGEDGQWRASVDAEQLGGYIEWRPARPGAAAGRLYARLARLSLPPSEAQSVETYLAQSPSSVPALDIVVDDFELSGKRLGRVEIEAVNRGGAGSRDWRLNKLEVAVPEARLSGSGHWSGGGRGPSRMVMDFRLDLADSGAFAERLGMGRVLRGGKGRMQGQIAWDGSPLAPHVPSLDGQISLALDAGQFLKVAPGMGRLLGVLSLQALPRRLTLDFRDLFGEGFAFDNVNGDVTLRDGEARTNNLRMRGVQAAVLMEGQADIEDETQDLRVIVVPELNAGTASLAYAVINPAVGLGSFVAQMFLRKPLMAASTREFHISGTFTDPKVEKVARALDAPLPEIEPPTPAASAPPRVAN
ncbi:TIGR02099 family protein [Aquincola tertiaricarbonis]|uniref:TIGR02099 family protein n=1 Tax=Aquincola tertiaricarbonis TaxID=391953 RepID=A0ABY4SGW8_AQUTE|nr:YhdP family protein [Aquincola tertiaricarbonis]URI10454.1 TIGR02099 family protein [Aquincola tertiaricarbonis]